MSAGSRVRMLFISLLLSWALTACSIGTPWPHALAEPGSAGDEQVVLVVTRVVVDAANRSEFDRQNAKVLARMSRQAGLIGFAARRELFGSQGWTLSVWASDEDRMNFVRSAVHQEAMAKSQPALVAAEFKRLTVKRRDLPANWDQALSLLAEPEGLRQHWQ